MDRSAIYAACLLLLAAGCGRGVPELPRVAVDGMAAGVREAVEAASREASAKPEDAGAVGRYGMTLHAHGEFQAAAQAYRRAAGFVPEEARWQYLLGVALAEGGHPDEALEPLRKAAERDYSLAVRLRLADTVYALGRKDEALGEYDAASALSPTHPSPHYGRGRCLTGEAAVEALRKAVQLYPRYGAARFALAAALRNAGRTDEATAALAGYERDKLIAPPVDDPALAEVRSLDVSATGLVRAARAFEAKGDLSGALRLQTRAAAADPKLVEPWINLIGLRYRLGDAAGAHAAYEEALRRAPGHAEAQYNFGVLLAAEGDWAGARKAFAGAVAADGKHPGALDNLGATYERDGKLEIAENYYRQAVDSDPRFRLARFHLGRILANRRLYREAAEEFLRAVEPLDSQSSTYLYALGAARAGEGRRMEAMGALELASRVARQYQQGELLSVIERDLARLRQP